jgi:ABC-type polysaccharide/polyol phosphate transport system ATPase subunit
MSTSIKLDKVSLSVPLFVQHERVASSWASVFLGAIFDPPRRRLAEILSDISFEAHEGDRIALMGENGAGKSTLLKVLNGAYLPTSGQLHIEGETQALLNMSLGFNAEATVRENVLLRGTAMGLPTSFLRKEMQSILEFADLPDKVNHRLRTLSAGQRMRLGFAISTSVQQDILLMDEWVGTGDANFMAKARERLLSRVHGSKIVVLASHSIGLLKELCDKGMVMDGGKLLFSGDIASAIHFYHELLAAQWAFGAKSFAEVSERGPMAYGYVDEVLLPEPGKVLVKGWMTGTEGTHPRHVAIHWAGGHHAPTSFKRIRRPDVVNRFGLNDAMCGFHAGFDIAGIAKVDDFASGASILAGLHADEVSTPLRLSEQANETLKVR